MQFIHSEILYKINPLFSLFLFLSIIMIIVAACTILLYFFDACGFVTVAIIWISMILTVYCLYLIPRDIPSGKCLYEVIPLRDNWNELIDGKYVVVEQRGVVYVLEDINV